MGVWSNHKEESDKKADKCVPCGEYDVVITDVKRQSKKSNPNSQYCLVEFGTLPEGEVPAIFLNDCAQTGDAHTDAWLHAKACHTLDDIASSAGVNLDDFPDIDLDDPVRDAAKRLINCKIHVQVVENAKLNSGKETIPIAPTGI